MKINVPTPHNEAKMGDIAKTVLMPGDPLRAKYIAENFLEDAKLYNNVRGMLGYTGTYKGVKVSVQGSGMGVPSIAIYSMELFAGYDVDNIIRVGSAGSMDNDEASDIAKTVELGDVIVALDAETDSNYAIANRFNYEPKASDKILNIAKGVAKDTVKFGTIYTSDSFYMDSDILKEISQTNCLAVEMETFALYMNAKATGKNALGIFTVTDKPLKAQGISSEQRQTGLNDMITLALDIAVELDKEKE